MITSKTTIKSNDSIYLANKLGDEIVMMNMQTGDFVTLNSVGAEIWSLASQPISFDRLICKLKEKFDISEDNCSSETRCFLDKAVEQQIFILDNTATA